MAVVAAFGTLANTINAGLVAYFRPTGCTALTIADAIPLFSKITIYEQEYVIGEMKIWDSGSESGEPNNCTMVRVIVYNDGWICAWFDEEAYNQGSTGTCGFIDAQTLNNFGTFAEYPNKWDGCYLTIESSSPTDSECPDGTIFCIRNTDSILGQIQVHEDKSSTAYHFNTGHTYTVNVKMTNGNLVWWENQIGSASIPTNLSNRLYRAIYEMYEYLRFSSNSTDSTDTSISAAFLDDGGSFTDYTTAFNNSSVNDVPLIPSIESVNDAFYFGSNNKFSGLKLDIDTAGIGNTIVWEYWDGLAWTSLTVTDLTNGFTVLTIHNHKIDDTTNTITSTNATDQATLNTLLNEIKADYNAHRVSTTFHDSADTINVISSSNATDLTTSITLANEIKTDYNAHRSQSGVHPYDDSENAVTAADATNLVTCITLANEIKSNYNDHLVSTQDANTVTFITPDDWSKSFINLSEQFWIRSRISVAAFTTQPLLTQGWIIVSDSLEYSNSNLGMYSFENTSAKYCLICGIYHSTATTTNHQTLDSDKYFYNTSLLGKTIYSHAVSYGVYLYKGDYARGYIYINGKQIFYEPNAIFTTNGFIILNIEGIDGAVGVQNVYYSRHYIDSGFNQPANAKTNFASVLITS